MNRKSYPTQEALSATFAVFDYCGQTINRVTEGDVRSNKSLITEYLEGKAVPFAVTDQHREQAAQVVTFLEQTKMVKMLVNGRVDSFMDNVLETVKKPTVMQRDLGLLAWTPKIEIGYRKKETARVESGYYELKSRHIGKVGDKVTFNFTLIEDRYVKNYNMYTVYGRDDDGNLVFYWAKDRSKIIASGTISARIKSHRKDEYRNGAYVTSLNYVKVVK
jgi:hypothetical protein